MAPPTIAIVLIAAVAHAVWNTVSKYKQGDTILFVGAYTFAATLICVPIGTVRILNGAQHVSWQLAAGSAVSALLHVIYFVTLQTGYDRYELGVVYPVARGVGPILVVLSAILFLGERPSRTAIVGAALIVAGIVVVAGNPLRSGERHPIHGMLWGAATGATIAAYTAWDGYSVIFLHLNPLTYFTATLVLQSLILTPAAFRRRHHLRNAVRTNAAPILGVAALSPAAYILVLTAMQTAPIATVAPLRESSIVIGSLLAWRLFGETHLARRLTGASIVLAGIAAISL